MNKSKAERSSGRTILLVDDDAEYVETMRLLLEHEGHQVLSAFNGTQALTLLHQKPVDLMLLDYFMPDMTGEEVVARVRQSNPFVQVILQTGYASEKPRREMLRRLDIQGYYDKGEGAEKFLMWTDVGLRAAATVQFLNTNRQGLHYILDATPNLHRIRPLEDLLREILHQMMRLMGLPEFALATLLQGAEAPSLPAGFLAMLEDDAELLIRASVGRFELQRRVEDVLNPAQANALRQALQLGQIELAENAALIPLRVGGLSLGIVDVEWHGRPASGGELLQIFANQAAVAIQNIQLYEMATLDPLTGVYVRRFFEQWLLRELRTAFRTRQPLALLMIDMDGLKQINDTAGHLTGDLALSELGGVLRRAVRTSDIIGRYGGDEFAVILPQTPREGAEQVGQRILELMRDKRVQGPQGALPLTGSVGLGALQVPDFGGAKFPGRVSQAYFQMISEALLLRADESLYQAKREGGNRLGACGLATWPLPEVSPGC